MFVGDLTSSGCLQCPSTVQVMPRSDALINRFSKKRKFSALGGYREAEMSEGVGSSDLVAYLKQDYGRQPAAHSQLPLGVRKQQRKEYVFRGKRPPQPQEREQGLGEYLNGTSSWSSVKLGSSGPLVP